ncbi:Bone morphogenetic protein 1 [Thelohanellus kitauei]|uniref:Bone morphogenetic protein 1 n=1 Tax=Thelohanellus kitauei TaxID=669202 RepID=A0A0C2JCL4_THEKT|nr:Bone morphogenetic protein 1 [Thelohanellus kitauei]
MRLCSILIFITQSFLIKNEQRCGGEFNEHFGSYVSENFPKFYRNSMNCVWIIRLDKYSLIDLQIVYLNVENHKTCKTDYLQISEFHRNQSLIYSKKYCGLQRSISYLSETNELFITFVSDKSINFGGFEFKWNREISISYEGPAFKLISRIKFKNIFQYNNSIIGQAENDSLYYFDTETRDVIEIVGDIKNPVKFGYLNGLIVMSDRDIRIYNMTKGNPIRASRYSIVWIGGQDFEIVKDSDYILIKIMNEGWICLNVKQTNYDFFHNLKNFTQIRCNYFGCFFKTRHHYYYQELRYTIEPLMPNPVQSYDTFDSVLGGVDGVFGIKNCSLHYLTSLDGEIINYSSDLVVDRCFKAVMVTVNYIYIIGENGYISQNSNDFECVVYIEPNFTYEKTGMKAKRCTYINLAPTGKLLMNLRVEIQDSPSNVWIYIKNQDGFRQIKLENMIIKINPSKLKISIPNIHDVTVRFEDIIADKVTECGNVFTAIEKVLTFESMAGYRMDCLWTFDPHLESFTVLILIESANSDRSDAKLLFNNQEIDFFTARFMQLNVYQRVLNVHLNTNPTDRVKMRLIATNQQHCQMLIQNEVGYFKYPDMMFENARQRCWITIMLNDSLLHSNSGYLVINITLGNVRPSNLGPCSGLVIYDGQNFHFPIRTLREPVKNFGMSFSNFHADLLYDFIPDPSLPIFEVSWRFETFDYDISACSSTLITKPTGHIFYVPVFHEGTKYSDCKYTIRPEAQKYEPSDSPPMLYLYTGSQFLDFVKNIDINVSNTIFKPKKDEPTVFYENKVDLLFFGPIFNAIYFAYVDPSNYLRCFDRHTSVWGDEFNKTKGSVSISNFCGDWYYGTTGQIVLKPKPGNEDTKYCVFYIKITKYAKLILMPSFWFVQNVCLNKNAIFIIHTAKLTTITKSEICRSFYIGSMIIDSDSVSIQIGGVKNLSHNQPILSWKSYENTNLVSECGNNYNENTSEIIINSTHALEKLKNMEVCSFYIILNSERSHSRGTMVYETIFKSNRTTTCEENGIRILNAVTGTVQNEKCLWSGSDTAVDLELPINYDIRIDIRAWCSDVELIKFKWDFQNNK